MKNDDRKETTMKVKVFDIKTTAGKRYGLVNATTNAVLHCATAKWKTKRGAESFARRMGFELVD